MYGWTDGLTGCMSVTNNHLIPHHNYDAVKHDAAFPATASLSRSGTKIASASRMCSLCTQSRQSENEA